MTDAAVPLRVARPPLVALGIAAGALAALWLAADAGVEGPGAVPDVLRTVAACVVVFGVCGYAVATRTLPPSLAPWWPLFVLPLGAAVCGLTLTALGHAGLPFKPALVAVLCLSAVAAVAAGRWPEARGRDAASVAITAALIVAVALIPTFRTGIATVTGTGADAHQIAGYATFVQHNSPGDYASEYPLDFVRYEWESKYPIFYGVAAVSSVAGLEPWQTMITIGAALLALAGVGFFLVARALGAGAGLALLAMALAVLDRQVLHVATHPYHNQDWGLLTMPFALVLAFAAARDRSPRTLVPLVLVLLLGALAYPLMLPFPLVGVVVAFLVDRRARRRRGESLPSLDPRRLWRGPLSLAWIVPLVALVLLPLPAVADKVGEFWDLITSLDRSLPEWRGDVQAYAPFGEFFGLPRGAVLPTVAFLVLIAGAAAYGAWRAPRPVGVALAAITVPALACAGIFRAHESGDYIYFKILAFAGPLVVVACVAGLGRLVAGRVLALRVTAACALLALPAAAVLNVRREVSGSFDQLTPEQIELREWSARLPPGASVRLDTPPRTQIWDAYFLSDRPLGSRTPNLFYWHVPYSEGADYALDRTLRPPPHGHVGEPLFRNARLRLWRLSSAAGADTTSRAQASYLGELRRGDPRLREIFKRGVPDPRR